LRLSSRMPVMRNPESTKKRLTPAHPSLAEARNRRSHMGTLGVAGVKNSNPWNQNTSRIATPRMVSSSGIRERMIGSAILGLGLFIAECLFRSASAGTQLQAKGLAIVGIISLWALLKSQRYLARGLKRDE